MTDKVKPVTATYRMAPSSFVELAAAAIVTEPVTACRVMSPPSAITTSSCWMESAARRMTLPPEVTTPVPALAIVMLPVVVKSEA